MNINDFLPTVPIFSTLEPEELASVKPFIEKKLLQENSVLFEEGDPGDAMFIVAVGAVKIIKSIDDNKGKVVGTFSEGDFFGELALLDGQPRSAGAVVTRTSVILKIGFDNFRQLMNKSPFAALKIISQIACYLSIRLRTTNLKLAELENEKLLRK